MCRNFSYQSKINLSALYPTSSLDITKSPKEKASATPSDFSGYIPMDRVDIKYTSSSGPGGQHVNRSNTKVQVKFKPAEATWLPENVKTKFLDKHSHALSKEGCIIIKSDKTRYAHLNLADALDRLRNIIWNSLQPESIPPSEESVEKHRLGQLRAARERLREKRNRSDIKRARQSIDI